MSLTRGPYLLFNNKEKYLFVLISVIYIYIISTWFIFIRCLYIHIVLHFLYIPTLYKYIGCFIDRKEAEHFLFSYRSKPESAMSSVPRF